MKTGERAMVRALVRSRVKVRPGKRYTVEEVLAIVNSNKGPRNVNGNLRNAADGLSSEQIVALSDRFANRWAVMQCLAAAEAKIAAALEEDDWLGITEAEDAA